MRRILSLEWVFAWFLCFGLAWAAEAAPAGGLNDLLNQKNLTPEAFARGFADYAFELAPQVQAPETFLQRKRGDCADFANLASLVLTHRGYTTKMVVIMMAKETHVVCYVKEAGGFLDYNFRADSHPVVASDGSLEDIAGKVAGYFRSPWRMASAFRYRDGSPVYLDNVFFTGAAPAAMTVRRPMTQRAAPSPRTDVSAAEATVRPSAMQAVIN